MKQHSEYWYGKTASSMMAGIAVLLMLCHHFFGFKEYLLPAVKWISVGTVGGIEVERILAAFGKICVSIFAFNTGYVIWVKQSDYLNYRNTTKRILKFLSKYWIVCLSFWLYAIFFDNLPPLKSAFLNLIGLNTGPNYHYANSAFAWYVFYYCCFVLLSPLWICIFRKTGIITDVAIVIFIALLYPWLNGKCDFVYYTTIPVIVGLTGLTIAKWRIFERIDKNLGNRIKWFHGLILFLILVLLRQGWCLMSEKYALASASYELINIICTTLFIYVCVRITPPELENSESVFDLRNI